MATLGDLVRIGDHIEIDHERELAPLPEESISAANDRLRKMHLFMHVTRDDWGHSHG